MDDPWCDIVPKLAYPQLSSFAWNENISLMNVASPQHFIHSSTCLYESKHMNNTAYCLITFRQGTCQIQKINGLTFGAISFTYILLPPFCGLIIDYLDIKKCNRSKKGKYLSAPFFMELIIMVCWSIWSIRNALFFLYIMRRHQAKMSRFLQV